MSSSDGLPEDDRTTRARIRDAAITSFADNGIAATTVRAIAGAAGVSPGLIIHHFGSKDALRAACDRHIVALVREQKRAAMQAGPGYDPLTTLREARGGLPLARYLARTLVEGTGQVAELVDEMVADAAEYSEEGVRSGMLRPTAYPYERAAVLTIWSLGALVLHEHLERLLGVDLTADMTADPTAAARYIGPAVEVMTEGFVNAEVAARMKEVLVDGSASSDTEQDPDEDAEQEEQR